MFAKALCETNLKWYGADIFEKVPIVEQFSDLASDETKGVPLD